jgi:cell wall-associated NlpC family hydrolase
MGIDSRAGKHLGQPWLPGGRGASGGLDCLGLALQICEPPPPDVRANTFEPYMSEDYEPVLNRDFESGDLLISHQVREGKRVAHLAVIADNPAWCWTTSAATGVCKVRAFNMLPAKAYRRK